jgi:hypothetical protein
MCPAIVHLVTLFLEERLEILLERITSMVSAQCNAPGFIRRRRFRLASYRRGINRDHTALPHCTLNDALHDFLEFRFGKFAHLRLSLIH